MQNHHKLFYEAPTLDIVELKLEGVIAGSDPNNKVSSLTDYNGHNVFGGDDQDDQDW